MTAHIEERLLKIADKYPEREAAVLPALYVAQGEYGWLSHEALKRVSEILNLPEAFVRGVATFYYMYKNKPMGRHLIQICTNVSCMLFGGERIADLLRERFNLEPGGITEDGRFSLIIMECIGACDMAPAMLIGKDLHGGLNENNIFEILEGYK
ncbi:MAG: NADH-quinone oxidoreductase subunit NuoE [Thermodesulfovibrionales bacterium]